MQQIIDTVPFEHYTLIEDKAQISESFKDEVNNSHGAILAIVKGRHFCPNGTSRNHRFYPKELWCGVKNDENFMSRLKRNGVIGRVGHDPEITDEDIGNGNFSHFTRNINWETGEAESVIVDTHMGRNLLTALRAGITLFVSSRATGDYAGKTESGDDIMDPKTYALERFDFVQDPGFLEAHPTLVSEALEKSSPNKAIAEALLRIAQKINARLYLDGRHYVVESLDKSSIQMATADTHISETYDSSAFEDVLPELEEAIVKAADMSAINEELRVARFANENGLDEAFVRSRLDAGVPFEMIAKAHAPAPQAFRIAESQTVNRPRKESVLNRIFR